MPAVKKMLGMNVYESAKQRISTIFDNFDKVYLSFSGGKDSTVMYHVAAEVARAKKRKFGVMIIDWECQYKLTMDHIREMVEQYADVSEVFWVCLPMKTVNAVSVFEPEWIAWEAGKAWVREKPDIAIKDESYFPFYTYAMTFEEFVPKFGLWYAGDGKCANMIGIRTVESLNRWRTVSGMQNKTTFGGFNWTTGYMDKVYSAYPIYDWATEDIWIYCGKFNKCYNRLYDRFYQAGMSLGRMRICEPFGNEQRQSLDFYQVIEPETWGKLVARVNGANFGSVYARERGVVLGNDYVNKPDNITWQKFAELLLHSMPKSTAEHYRNKFAVYLKFYEKVHGVGAQMPDEAPNDTSSKDVPSWRRFCRALLRNDYWCKSLSFAPTKVSAYEKYCELMKKRREEWKLI